MEVKINNTEMVYNHTIIHCIDTEYREYDDYNIIENLNNVVNEANNKCPWIYQPNLKTYISMSYNNFKNYENFIIRLSYEFSPRFMGFDIKIDLNLCDNEYLFNIKTYYNASNRFMSEQ
jgi:hypothetical protein